MKPYRILRTFAGNQTGNGETEHFMEGTVRNLTDHLAEVVLKEGWVKQASSSEYLETVTADVVGLDGPVPEGNLEEDIANPAEIRETKVTGPEETKPDLSSMKHKELVNLAKERGINSKGMNTEALIEALKAA